jgi:predicted nucleic acid-binding protein
MIARAFADTNIVIYAESDDGEKSKIALAVLEAAPVISAQVVNETVAALIAGCDTLSEDMQNGQVIEGHLTIRNPFVVE